MRYATNANQLQLPQNTPAAQNTPSSGVAGPPASEGTKLLMITTQVTTAAGLSAISATPTRKP